MAASAPSASSLSAVRPRVSLASDPVMHDAKLYARVRDAVATKFFDRDAEDWPELFKLKLLFCYRPANFQADSKKDPAAVEFKEKKREILIELIDVLDESPADEILHTEEIL